MIPQVGKTAGEQGEKYTFSQKLRKAWCGKQNMTTEEARDANEQVSKS